MNHAKVVHINGGSVYMIDTEKKALLRRKADEFKEKYLETDIGGNHLAWYERERKEVQVTFAEIRNKHVSGVDITEDVLRQLLPHFGNRLTRERGYRISTWPVITGDVKKWFENAGWQQAKYWPNVAEALFNLIEGLLTDRNPQHLVDFRDSAFSKGFQLGFISPILYCLDPYFLVVNSKNVDTVKFFEPGARVETRLRTYFQSLETIRRFLKECGVPLFDSYDAFDAFCHWSCTPGLGGYASSKKPRKNSEPVPETEGIEKPSVPGKRSNESTHTSIEWALIFMGRNSGFETWLTRSDRGKKYMGKTIGGDSVESLPDLGLQSGVKRKIESIDVLWLEGGMVVAAFEVEHTTSIETGLNRLNDLALSAPNFTIDLYIVAPDERFEKLNRELLRPTFRSLRPRVGYIPYSVVEQKTQDAMKIAELGGTLKKDFLTANTKRL